MRDIFKLPLKFYQKGVFFLLKIISINSLTIACLYFRYTFVY